MTCEAIHALGSWPIILICVAVGAVPAYLAGYKRGWNRRAGWTIARVVR